jgi:hypothetical protein
MEDSLNPYASPQFDASTPVLDEQRTLTVTFVIDSLWQRRAARKVTPRQQDRIMFLMGMIFIFTCLITTAVICLRSTDLDGFLFFLVLALGLWLGAILGLFCVVPLMWACYLVNWAFRSPQYPRGSCQLIIEVDQVRLITPHEQVERLLKEATYESSEWKIWFFLSPIDQALMIEHTADFGDDDFESWQRALGKRLRAAVERARSEG